MSKSALNRIKIVAYKGSKKPKEESHFSEKNQVDDGEFIVQANPDTFSLRYSAEYNKKNQAGGRAFYDPEWEKHLPRNLSLEFIFDGTGAIPQYLNKTQEAEKKDVGEMLKRFKRIVYDVNSKTHAPHYLEISWGDVLQFKCRLTEMNVTYKMFSPDGRPLRATVSATFQEVIPKVLEDKQSKKSSSDMTHKRTVKEGDKLPQMAEDIYGDADYYPAIAKENKLIQFRNMPPGQEVYFPPVEKEQTTESPC